MTDDRKSEIEIIPPGEEEEHSRIFFGTGETHVRVVKLGPLGTIAALVAGVAVLFLFFAFFSGLALIAIPAALLLGAGAWVSGLLGGGPRKWLGR